MGSRPITAIINRPEIYARNGYIGDLCETKSEQENPEHRIFPYLLRGVKASYPNYIWGMDITFIRMNKGWLYLVAFMDWFSRYVLAWELDFTLEVDFVLAALGVNVRWCLAEECVGCNISP